MHARQRYVAVVLTLAVLLLAARGAAAAEDPATVFRRFIDARNQGDVAGALALVTDDIRVIGGPRCTESAPCVGKDAVRADLQAFSTTNHAQSTIVGTPQLTGATVRARIEARDDSTRAAGVDRFVNDVTVETRDGKIASLHAVPDTSDPQTARYLAYVRGLQGQPAPGMPNTGGGGARAPHAAPSWGFLVGGSVILAGLLGMVARRRPRT